MIYALGILTGIAIVILPYVSYMIYTYYKGRHKHIEVISPKAINDLKVFFETVKGTENP